jgi:hypothetical protein
VSEERLFPFLSMCSKLFREFQKRIIEHQFQTSSRISYRIGYMPLLTSFLPVLHSGTFSPTAEVLTSSVNATWQFQLPNSSKMTLCFMGVRSIRSCLDSLTGLEYLAWQAFRRCFWGSDTMQYRYAWGLGCKNRKEAEFKNPCSTFFPISTV